MTGAPAKSMPVVLTVAGSDSGGGAGIQADLRAFQISRVFGVTALTAVTAQNPHGVRAIQAVAPNVLNDQIEAIFDAFDVCAAKTGMLFSQPHIEQTAEAFAKRPEVPLVVDPVMVATSGARLLQPDAVEALTSRLLPLATVITPNLAEAAILLQRPALSMAEPWQARELSERFGCAVLLKGGHGTAQRSRDILWENGKGWWLESAVVPVSKNAGHGTGCSLSAALAASLACGETILESARAAKAYVLGALQNTVRVGVDVHAMCPVPNRPLDAVTVREISLDQTDQTDQSDRSDHIPQPTASHRR